MDPEHRPEQDDLENPYAPPESTFVQDLPLGPFGRIDFNVGDLFVWTVSLYKQQLRICVIIVCGAAAINFGINMGLNLLLSTAVTTIRDPIFAAITQIAITFGAWIAGFWLNVGTNLAILKVVRRQEVAFDDVFTGGRFVLTTVLAWIVWAICVIGPMALAIFGVPALFPILRDDQSALPVVLAVVVLCVLGLLAVYLSIRLSQFTFVVIDRNAGVFESLQTSWHLTRNREATIFLVYLLWFTMNLAGLIACCVGLIFTAPLGNLLLAVTYQALTGQTPVAEVQFLDSWDVDKDKE